VQEVQYDGSIKQLYMANGGDWGGTKTTNLQQVIDKLYHTMLYRVGFELTILVVIGVIA
jgi:hypothetical protein